ncbi:hypothetical protein [Pseudomonas sp. 8O]|uniref:hypothetical protein n=1 Tax=Pseudomonas sp. 8O TaxID=2653165 RepID=UPI0012F311A1|nr:hypothetical protein [Pseudomonas sp. 8O]VXC35828.1 conserved hypothetical protein [Pseudomonas sp. 8O]
MKIQSIRKATALRAPAPAWLLTLLLAPTTLLAETITIGKGSGIIWEGLPFSATLQHTGNNGGASESAPLAGIVDSSASSIIASSALMNIGGFRAFPILRNGQPTGVGLVPRTQVNGTFPLVGTSSPTPFSGSIGLPTTSGSYINGYGFQLGLGEPSARAWALTPCVISGICSNFYRSGEPISVTLTGSWVMVADGTQQAASSIALPPMWAVSHASSSSSRINQQILSGGLDLRISTIECTVSAPAIINFGQVGKNLIAHSELSRKSMQAGVNCNQEADGAISVDVNLQFRATSGLYEGNPAWLGVNQGTSGSTPAAAYITGEVSGASGPGTCGAGTGLKFDLSRTRIGHLSNTELLKTFAPQFIWRLCSGGSQLTTGEVNASAEMMVTFN